MQTTSEELLLEPRLAGIQYWKDLWKYRELFFFLSWCDFLVRYKQTAIGIVWALLRPFLSMVIFTIVFGKLAHLPSDGAVPYSVLVYVATLPWQFFSNSVSESSNSLIANPNLVSKVYFPRLIVPASSVATCFADLVIAFAILVPMLAWYGCWPDWRVIFLPGFIAMAFLVSVGTGFWLCSLNVAYRDFRYIVPFVIQLGVFLSPVGFSSSVIPKHWRLLYSFNPMVGVIDGFRWTLLRGQTPLYWPGLWASLITAIAVCATGIRYFRKTEIWFADVI